MRWGCCLFASFLIGISIVVSTAQCNLEFDALIFPTITVSNLTIWEEFYFEKNSDIIVWGGNSVHITNDAGKHWEKLDFEYDGLDMEVIDFLDFQYFPDIAMIFTNTKRQFYTLDQGQTWNHFDLLCDLEAANPSAQINYANKNYILFTFDYFVDGELLQHTYYSDDGLETSPKFVTEENIAQCIFTKINPEFTQGNDATIVCVKKECNGTNRIVLTGDFFKTIIDSDCADLPDSQGPSLYISGSFIVWNSAFPIGCAFFYTSRDGINFFKESLEDQSSDDTSYFVTAGKNELYVSTSNVLFGDLNEPRMDVYKSDSDGKNFRKLFGNVSSVPFHSVRFSDNIWIASHVDAGLESMFETIDLTEESSQLLALKTIITFDDGKTWDYLKISDSDIYCDKEECSLHITEIIYVQNEPNEVIPTMLVGYGNLGRYLDKSYNNLKTLISTSGGSSWEILYDKPCAFACGDSGNIFVVVPFPDFSSSNEDNHLIDYFSYSLDQGKTWTAVTFGKKLDPLRFIQKSENTDKTFIFTAYDVEDEKDVVYHIDFTGVTEKSDMRSTVYDPNIGGNFDGVINQKPLIKIIR